MSCKIKSIEDRFRELNPELADKLNDLAVNTWRDLSNSKLFMEKDNVLFVNKEGTKKRVKQDQLISDLNTNILQDNGIKDEIQSINITEDSKVSVNMIPLGEVLDSNKQQIAKVNVDYSNSESDFKNQIERYIAINQLFESDSNLANQVYEALGFQIKSYDKPWKDGTNTNKAKSFALKNKPSEIFELVEDKEKGNYSVHFKTSQKNSLSNEEKQKLIEVVAANIPVGSKLSTWGTVTEGGFAGLERFLQAGFIKISETRDSGGNIIPVYIKQNKSNLEQQALQLYSQYLQQNPNDSVEQFKNWVEEFNRKLHPLTIEEFSKLQREVHSKITESKFKKYKNVKELLNDIINSNKEDSYNSILAKFLLNVKGVNDSFLELNKDFKKGYYGDYSGLGRKIRLSKELNSNKSLFEITALHEILHLSLIHI